MAFSEALRLVLTADTQGAVRGIEQVGKAADRNLSRSEQQMERWGNRLTSLGSGLIAFGAVAAYGLGQAARSAGELEQAVGGTEAVFGEASATIDAYAANAADKVGLSETAFRTASTSIGGQLKRMGLDVDTAAAKSIELTEVAADLAATYGGTTAEAVEALGSAFRGEADPAERFNLDLKVSKVNAEAVALGLAESTSAVDDNARAQAILSLVMKQSADASGQFGRESDTLQGRQQRLSAEFENLKASIGEGVLPVMETLFDVASKGVGAFSGLNESTGGLVGKAATLATVAALGAGGLSLMVGQALKMHQSFSAAKDAVVGLSGRLGGLSGLASGLSIVGPLTVGAAIAMKAYGDTKAEAARITDRLVQALQDEAAGMDGATDAALAAELTAGDLGSKLRDAGADLGVFSDAIRSSGDQIEELDDKIGAVGLDEALDRAGLAGSNFADELQRVTEGMSKGEIVDLVSRLDGLSDRYDNASEAAANTEFAESQLADQHGESAAAVDELTGATGEATSSLEAYGDALQALFDPLFGAIDAAHGLSEANAKVAEAEAAVAVATRDHGAGSAEAVTAQRELTDAQVAASGAALDQESSLLVLRDAVDSGAVSVAAAKAKLAEWVSQGVITQATADATAQALDGVTWSANSIPAGKSIDISMTGAAPVLGQLDAIARKVNALSGGRFHVSVGGGGGLVLHDGGIVPGPRGQEVAAVLQAGEGVVSLDQMDKLSSGRVIAAGGGGGGGTVVINVMVDRPIVASGYEFEKMVAAATQRAVRTGGLHLAVDGKRVR